MKFRYSVARYMPSLVRGETLNLGVAIEDSAGQIAARFLSRLSHVRTVYPDADMATLRLIRDYFAVRYPAGNAQGTLFGVGPLESLDELVRSNQNVISFSDPKVTIGDSLLSELDDLFTTLVQPTTSLAPKPMRAVQVAPSRLRTRLENWLTKHSFFGPDRYQRSIEVPGTVYPWTFDFGLYNGKTTIVQTVALKDQLDAAMNRAALFAARVDDARAARFRLNAPSVDVVAVPDTLDAHNEPIEYLREHTIEVIPLADANSLQARLEEPLLALH